MRKKIIFSFFTLLIGSIIYFLSDTNILVKTNFITAFIRNYLPDILWTISFYTISTLLAKNITKNYILLSAVYVISIGILFELLQFTGIVRGTFDVWDILVYIIFSLVACLIEKKYWRDNL